jgi:hypothetical protein
MKKLFLMLIIPMLSCAQTAKVKAYHPEIEDTWIFYYDNGNKACEVFLREDFYNISYIDGAFLSSSESGSFTLKNDTLFFTTKDGAKSQYSPQEVFFTSEKKETLHIGNLGDFQRLEK